MIDFAKLCGEEIGLKLIDGAYDVWTLPNFETAADIQFTKEAGALVTGASTVPEQIAAAMMGVKTLGIAAVSNPATGTIVGWIHEQEFYIQSAKKCIANLKNIIFKCVENFQLQDDHKVKLNHHLGRGSEGLSLKQISPDLKYDTIVSSISDKVKEFISEPISKVLWLMSD